MPVSRRRKPKEREIGTPSTWKRAMKAAMIKRLAAEREAIDVAFPFRKNGRPRLEEGQALMFLKDIPSVFAFAEQEGVGYMRPEWASSRWGAR